LGEIIQEDIAAASAIKTRRLIAGPRDPLIRLWETLHKIILKKLGKRCDPEARPLSLLLYYQSNPFQRRAPLAMVRLRLPSRACALLWRDVFRWRLVEA
jgi:hypothetical protein